MPNIVKKEKKPSKKEVITDIENLDTEKRFDIKSLMRTNIDNLIGIRNLLRGNS